MAVENNTPATTPSVDSPEGNYADFASVFDNLIDKEPQHDNSAEGDSQDGAAGAAGDAGEQVQQADGAGDSGQPAEEGGNAADADAQGAQDDQGGDAAGGQQGDQGVDWEARFRDLESRITAPAAPAPAAEPTAAPEVYSADEKAELADLQKEWPDLHRLFSLMARQVQVDTLNYAFSEVSKVISPLQESVQTFSVNDHTAAIYEAHDDYDQVYQPVMDWVEKQPGFLKAAYQNVVKQGTAEDVAELIQRFKDETKWVSSASGDNGSKPATPRAAASTPSQQQTGLSEAAKKAAKAMGAVGTKRGAAAGAQDPNDFDGAWDEANAA
jgi:hypothetical protein